MNIHALMTPSDCFFWSGVFGDEGTCRIFDIAAEAGISRLYLRTHDGGRANYPSQHGPTLRGIDVYNDYVGDMRAVGSPYPKSYYRYLRSLDYDKWSPHTNFARNATDYDIEPALWTTIMEDNHGQPLLSRFATENPQLRCVKRNGEPVAGCLEFWFKPVRDYKLKVVDEVLGLGPKRIVFDLVRRNGLPSADVNGFYQYGFNPEIIEAFRKESALDARRLTPGSDDWKAWVDFVSKPYTEFFQEVFRRAKSRGIAVELMTWPVNLKTWMAIDLEKILDSGAVEAVHVQSHTYSYSPAEMNRQFAALRPQVGSRNVEIIPSITGYDGVVAAGLDRYFQAMEKSGVRSVVVHEIDAVYRNRVGERFRALKFGVPHYQRMLRPRRVESLDWNEIAKFSGFLRGYNATSLETDQVTDVQTAYDGQTLHIRVTGHERNPKALIPVPQWPADSYNVKVLGARTWWSPDESVHLFLSPANQFNDYFHFVLDPSGAAKQEQRLDEAWNGAWSHEVKIENDRWTATFHIPFASLQFQPQRGARIAAQIVRSQNNPKEVSLLYMAGTSVVNADEFGFWEFA